MSVDHKREAPAQSTISVIIVSYNTAALLARCISSLQPQLRVNDELIVVDNASIDGSVGMIARDCPSVRVIPRSENLGFGRACNAGAAAASGDYLLFFNPDAVPLGGMIDALRDGASRHPQAGIYGGRAVHGDGSIDPRSCWGRPTVWSTLCFAVGLSTAFKRNRLFDPESLGRWERDTECPVDVVSGAMMLVDRRLWQQLGGFDERYFMYGEDLDLCVRARQRGASPMLLPGAAMVHEAGASSTQAQKRVLLLRGKITAMVRLNPGWRGRMMKLLTIGGTGLRASFGARSRNSWWQAWQQRMVWSDGYPERADDAVSEGHRTDS